jgi:hypothetical protein
MEYVTLRNVVISPCFRDYEDDPDRWGDLEKLEKNLLR